MTDARLPPQSNDRFGSDHPLTQKIASPTRDPGPKRPRAHRKKSKKQLSMSQRSASLKKKPRRASSRSSTSMRSTNSSKKNFTPTKAQAPKFTGSGDRQAAVDKRIRASQSRAMKMSMFRLMQRRLLKEDYEWSREQAIVEEKVHQGKRLHKWKKKLKKSPFSVDLVADTERIEEEQYVRKMISQRRRRMEKKKMNELKHQLIVNALKEEPPVHPGDGGEPMHKRGASTSQLEEGESYAERMETQQKLRELQRLREQNLAPIFNADDLIDEEEGASDDDDESSQLPQENTTQSDLPTATQETNSPATGNKSLQDSFNMDDLGDISDLIDDEA